MAAPSGGGRTSAAMVRREGERERSSSNGGSATDLRGIGDLDEARGWGRGGLPAAV
jgi:hypothetical protein